MKKVVSPEDAAAHEAYVDGLCFADGDAIWLFPRDLHGKGVRCDVCGKSCRTVGRVVVETGLTTTIDACWDRECYPTDAPVCLLCGCVVSHKCGATSFGTVCVRCKCAYEDPLAEHARRVAANAAVVVRQRALAAEVLASPEMTKIVVALVKKAAISSSPPARTARRIWHRC